MYISATLVLTPLLLDLAAAIPWPGPVPTQAGLIAMGGMSPRPTDAPGSEGIPQELRRRGVQYPPPDNWCGFVDGDYGNVLSCNTQDTCARSGAAIGCCPAATGSCDGLYTTCYNYGDACDNACLNNVAIQKCSNPLFPYCGTYAFAGGTHLYNCQSAFMLAASVEFLNDYYVTAISSTLATPSVAHFAGASQSSGSSSALSSESLSASASSSSSAPFSFSSATPISFTTPNYLTTPTYTSSNSYSQSSGISSAAIGGIASGVSVGVAVVAGLIVFFCLRKRRRTRNAQSLATARANFPAPSQSPPVQQEQVYPKTVEGGTYQTVPEQQEQPAPQYPATQFGKAAPEYPADQAGFYSPPPPQAQGSLPVNHEQRPFSAAASTLSPTNASEIDGHTGDYYSKAPISPAITEVDGGRFVGPMHTGSTPTPAPSAGHVPSPVHEAPPSGGNGPVYEAPPPGGNGPVYEAPPSSGGYEAPPPSGGGPGPVYEVGNTPQYQGPWEMPHE